MRNFVQDNHSITVPAPAAVASGGVVAVGGIVGVAVAGAQSGEDVAVLVRGVVELAKKAADDVTLGAKLYWDASNGYATITPGTNSRPLLGIAVKAAGAGSEAVQVLLGAHGLTGPSS